MPTCDILPGDVDPLKVRNKVGNLVLVEVVLRLIVGRDDGGTDGGLADIQQLGLQLLYRELRHLVRSGDLVTQLGLERNRKHITKTSSYFLRQIVLHQLLENVGFFWRWRWRRQISFVIVKATDLTRSHVNNPCFVIRD